MNLIPGEWYGSSVSAEDALGVPRKRCPLHKAIRNRQWSVVSGIIQTDPSQIGTTNGHGWSSMTLAIYHFAPLDTISEMLSLLSPQEQAKILSTPVPNGSRLCLHFAARYASNLETIMLLTEAYPAALLVASDDSVIPLERANYYRKDADILRYLELATKKQQDLVNLQKYNKSLRHTVLLACERYRNDQHPNNYYLEEADGNCLVACELYRYCKDREMIGLFWNVLGYVGVNSIP